MELTILMPCLNEENTIQDCILRANDFLTRSGIDGEVLVSDNGSTDSSVEFARNLGARVIFAAERGYGAALIAGIESARGQYIIMGDSDCSYDFSDLDAFVAVLRQGKQLVMGNRFRGGISPGAMPWLHRHLGNPVLSFFGRLFFKVPVEDFHCGLRGFDRSSVRALTLQCTGMEFASEMVVKAALRGLRIAEVPTTLSPDRRGRPPHLRTWRDGWRHLRFLLLFSPRWLFYYPGLALFFAGILIQLLLMSGPVDVASVVFDVHTMLYGAAATIVGSQLIVFAVLAKIFAVDQGILPESSRVERLKKWFSLEFGVALGAVSTVSGLLVSVGSLLAWDAVRFGDLEPAYGMRLVIPSVCLFVVGTQLLFASFFYGVLGLKAHGQKR